jgi:hypothetical protein
MSNAMLSLLWPFCYRAGLIRIVGRPATNYDARTHRPEARRRDLARRAAAYARRKQEAVK